MPNLGDFQPNPDPLEIYLPYLRDACYVLAAILVLCALLWKKSRPATRWSMGAGAIALAALPLLLDPACGCGYFLAASSRPTPTSGS